VEGTYRNAAGERRYLLHLPDKDPGAGNRVLVVMLHGCTQDAADVARGTRMNERANERGWLVLYPEQPSSAHPRKCWNWYEPVHQRRDGGEPSIIAGLTAQVIAEQLVDPRRVYLAGMSAGAAMASLVAAAYPELWSAIALHSGLIYQAAETVGEALGVMQKGASSVEPHAQAAFDAMGSRRRVLPVFVIHGGQDQVLVPLNGAQAARQWFLTNALALGQPLDTTSGATDLSEREEGGYRVTSATYRSKAGVPLAVLQIVKELGHAWSGGSTEGTFTDARGPDATERIFDFFADQVRR
jgi:poly(hydroxyalkanoate) depolymerase family esterase